LQDKNRKKVFRQIIGFQPNPQFLLFFDRPMSGQAVAVFRQPVRCVFPEKTRFSTGFQLFRLFLSFPP
jgi:hypothetical protein